VRNAYRIVVETGERIEFYFFENCGKHLTEHDIEGGLAKEAKGRFL